MHVDITLRGSVPDQVVEKARTEVGALERVVKGPLTGARVVLTQETNPRIGLQARAEGEVLLAGRPVRARVACPTMAAAVDELADTSSGSSRSSAGPQPTSPSGSGRGLRPVVAARCGSRTRYLTVLERHLRTPEERWAPT
jgi:hypothetical protein